MRRGVGIAAAKNKSLAQVTGKDNFNTIGVLKWSLVTCFVLNKMVPYYCFGLSSTYLYIARKIYLLTLRRFFLEKLTGMKRISNGDFDVFSPFGNQLKYQGHTCTISLEIPHTIFELHHPDNFSWLALKYQGHTCISLEISHTIFKLHHPDSFILLALQNSWSHRLSIVNCMYWNLTSYM